MAFGEIVVFVGIAAFEGIVASEGIVAMMEIVAFEAFAAFQGTVASAASGMEMLEAVLAAMFVLARPAESSIEGNEAVLKMAS